MQSLTYHSSLFVNQYRKIFENLIHFTNLLLYFLYSLISFLYDGLVESNFIVQQQNLLPAAQNSKK